MLVQGLPKICPPRLLPLNRLYGTYTRALINSKIKQFKVNPVQKNEKIYLLTSNNSSIAVEDSLGQGYISLSPPVRGCIWWYFIRSPEKTCNKITSVSS